MLGKSIMRIICITICVFSISLSFAGAPSSIFKLESKHGVNGTGFAVEEEGRIVVVTNLHVLLRLVPEEGEFTEKDIELTGADGRRISVRGVGRVWADRDLATILIDDTDIKPFKVNSLSDATLLSDTKFPLAVGFPEGEFNLIENINKPVRLNHGNFSFLSTLDKLVGSSGSPVLNEDKEVIGVLFEVVDNQVTAVSSYYLKQFLTENKGTRCSDGLRSCIKKEMARVSQLDKPGASTLNFLGHYQRPNNALQKEAAFIEAAKKGHVGAQLQLGIKFMKKDKETSIDWFQKAADQKNAVGVYYLGHLDKNKKEKNKKILKSAEQGYSRAINSWKKILKKQNGSEIQKPVELSVPKCPKQFNAS